MGDLDVLRAERDRIESELRSFEERQDRLEKERAEILRKTEAASGEGESQAQLKIELDQLAEAKRMNDRSMAETTRRLEEIETLIAMEVQSDMT